MKNTGRVGFDTGSEVSLTRVPSNNYSTPDFNPNVGPDPYAVPPLPHLNPNQPYRDDPTNATGFYDPYRGPVPGSIEQGVPPITEWGTEAIPMTQMGMAGRMSPGLHVAYGGPASDGIAYESGRRSPGPYAAYGGGAPPGVPYSGRMSPGPQAAYNISPEPRP